MTDGSRSSRGVTHAEASARAESLVNTSTSPASSNPTSATEVQVMRSPQPLSLQVDGLNGAKVASRHDSPNTAYIESSERGSDTSVDGRPPELQSASTLTDSLSSLPLSSANDANRSMEFGGSHANENQAIPSIDQKPQHPDGIAQNRPVNREGTMDGLYTSSGIAKSSNGSFPSVMSPKHSGTRSGMTLGHKRTATGDVKPVSLNPAASSSSDANGAARRRSKSTGSPAHGSRIAQLSVHIRTRLSYAAAKVEKSRQSRQAESQLPLRTQNSGSPMSSIMPAPNANPTSHPQDHSITTSAVTTHHYPKHHRSHSTLSSPNHLFPIPKLAPPADIIASNGDSRRRRPNHNTHSNSINHSPYSRHRRHHSHQEPAMNRPLSGSPTFSGPGTPFIPPPAHAAPTSSQNGFYRPRTNSQNTLMEQDAIETLLFMSSPENSGYRPSPRPIQGAATQGSLNASIHASQNGTMFDGSQGSQSDGTHNSQNLGSTNSKPGLEAHAGDDIDRILDQMESDSEDEGRFSSYRHGTNGMQSF
ncbi:hypothetical protein NUU61_008571 [Penicillium alfredii]|uniref:Uncharacterized protein n=1 Tax=Penicillium alfredii TaxID=1506179 RepID=A0A9W9ELG2_9EURO|nr:uncharacterized protein NUU61_008571 [Penicillium alfredii]KAJ5083992.1 hypothetical protein NUU61_008571 [Penicillium alfredii]